MSVTIAFLALIAELAAGYPQLLMRIVGHPVMWIGQTIDLMDRSFNRPGLLAISRRLAGVGALVLIAVIAAGIAVLVQWALISMPYGWIIVALLASTLIAQRSLAAHVKVVADRFESGGIEDGRTAVSQLVGRDVSALDESGVSRAAIESLAENFSDGVVAPVFWLVLGGLPGIATYKAINTADSMIGHKSEIHRDFGWATARVDDLVNLPASRLTALLVVIAAMLVPGASPRNAWQAVWRDARHHRSPNAGWPEAAFAGALGLELAGPRSYAGSTVDDAVMGKGGRPLAHIPDIRRALALYWAADLLMIALVAGLVLTVFSIGG